MDIKLKDYRRGAEIKLTLKDVPATMMPRAIDLFAMLLDEATEKQDAEPKVEWSCLGPDMTGRTTVGYGMTENALDPGGNPQSANAPEPIEPVKKRGRPRKVDAPSTAEVELAEETKENVEAMAEQMHGAPASEAPLQNSSAFEKVIESPSTLETVEEASPTPSETATDLPEVTHQELARYCVKVAQHFGGAQKVYDISAAFVPEGSLPRPSNIASNEGRWAFIKATEEASGVKYHG